MILFRFAYTLNELVPLCDGVNIRKKTRTILNKRYNELWSSYLNSKGIKTYSEVCINDALLKKYGMFIKP